MEFHQIRYFLAACDHMNFTRAAEACAVSQPALTVAIRKLEDELGGVLFDRDARQLTLTELGRAMRTHLARIEETRQAAGRVAQAVLDPASGQLDLGVFSTVGPAILAPAIEAFSAASPDIELVIYDVWGSKTFDLLLSGAFDCAIVASSQPLPPRIKAVTLTAEPMMLAMAPDHPLASRNSVSLSVLTETTYFDRLRCEARPAITDRLMELGIEPETRLRSESDSWIMHAVLAGKGVTIGPRSVFELPGLVAVPIADIDIQRRIEIVTVEGRKLSPAAERFVAFFREFDWSAYSAA